ncbi:MAG: hypothetical protein GY705_18690 [Bacteroidetes bacterium]|nr:hypothetical protein [Bacteroidota bacterium]
MNELEIIFTWGYSIGAFIGIMAAYSFLLMNKYSSLRKRYKCRENEIESDEIFSSPNKLSGRSSSPLKIAETMLLMTVVTFLILNSLILFFQFRVSVLLPYIMICAVLTLVAALFSLSMRCFKKDDYVQKQPSK